MIYSSWEVSIAVWVCVLASTDALTPGMSYFASYQAAINPCSSAGCVRQWMKGDGREQSASGCNLSWGAAHVLANPDVDVGQPLLGACLLERDELIEQGHGAPSQELPSARVPACADVSAVLGG